MVPSDEPQFLATIWFSLSEPSRWEQVFLTIKSENNTLCMFTTVQASQGGYQVNESLSAGMWPASPTARTPTRPDPRMTNQVMLALCKDILSHASGGTWSALKGKVLF